MITFRQGVYRKRRTEKLSLGNGKVMELILIKHDVAFQELNKF